MLYIKKEGLPNDINSKIIELSKSGKWKSISEEDTTAIRNAFDNDFPKNEVKEILLHEQHGICAYCMRRIRMDNHSRVEHLVPLSKNKDMAIDYNNMPCRRMRTPRGTARVSSPARAPEDRRAWSPRR